MAIPLVPLVLATLLSAHGLRKKSLSPSGAFAAFVVGFLMLSGGLYAFGVMLIGFYLTGSQATKYGKKRKAQLEEGYHEAGYRSGWQVLCNSASAFVAAFVWNAVFAPGSVHAKLDGILGINVQGLIGIKNAPRYDASWCPVDGSIAGGLSRMLLFAALGHFACCLGDTLASELGILSRGQPRLITTLRTVPAGTNGAMSVGGTLASITGGLVVGLVMGVSLVAENRECGVNVVVESGVWGMFGGGMGSLIDSVLGATVQQTRYSVSKGVVLQDSSRAGGEVQTISGWNVLTNNQVNLVSSTLSAGLLGWMTR
ncbi:integral membrane protein DUF92-domain-containing protein [Cyathus striatus]|nr:integral membrane protein DUF92-domain-containing protein [Cyathus striatus]